MCHWCARCSCTCAVCSGTKSRSGYSRPGSPIGGRLADACARAKLACAGPTQAAARLEGSKSFTKEICYAANIPTAQAERFTDVNAALTYVREKGAPIVIKADGLAAGKGVVVATTLAEAESAVQDMMLMDHLVMQAVVW